jgi:hypothetical protein
MPVLDVLVISDLHYVHEAEHSCMYEERRCALGLENLCRAFAALEQDGVTVGLIVILGDLVDDGTAPGAEKDQEAIARTARSFGPPVLTIPGNHDGPFEQVAGIFDCPPGLYEIGGYGWMLFHDPFDRNSVTTRTAEDLVRPEQVAETRPDLPLIAVQHNPLHPPILKDYPYLLANAEMALAGYRRAGVLLSLSGHYHPGQPAHPVDGVICYTVPAACEAPFHYAHVRLEGNDVDVRERALEEHNE